MCFSTFLSVYSSKTSCLFIFAFLTTGSRKTKLSMRAPDTERSRIRNTWMLEVRAESDCSTIAWVDSLKAESTLFMQF